MIQKTTVILISVTLLLLSACGKPEQSTTAPDTAGNANSGSPGGKEPPADVVRAEASRLEVKPGSSAEALVKLTIANGYHINANPPSFSYLKATELSVEPSEGITPGKAVYPSSITRTFGFSKEPLAVYEGETAIRLPLTVAADAKKGPHTLKGKLRIQACDDEACYPPKTIDMPLSVTVN